MQLQIKATRAEGKVTKEGIKGIITKTTKAIIVEVISKIDHGITKIKVGIEETTKTRAIKVVIEETTKTRVVAIEIRTIKEIIVDLWTD